MVLYTRMFTIHNTNIGNHVQVLLTIHNTNYYEAFPSTAYYPKHVDYYT